MPQNERIASGLTAEIGRRLGFGYRKGPPRSLSFWVLRLTIHSGLVLDIGKWRLALCQANTLVDESKAECEAIRELLAQAEGELRQANSDLKEYRTVLRGFTRMFDKDVSDLKDFLARKG